MLLNYFNKTLQKKAIANWKPNKYKKLSNNIYKALKNSGEGIYICSLKIGRYNLFTRLLALLNKGYNHTVPVLYCEDLKSYLSKEEWKFLEESFEFFYGEKGSDILSNCKTLILGSAQLEGMLFFDLSHYTRRKFTLHRTSITPSRILPLQKNKGYWGVKIRSVVSYFLNTDNNSRPYDVTGVIGFLLNKTLDDKSSSYCSEWTWEGFERSHIQISKIDNPNPYDIKRYLSSLGYDIYSQN